MIQAASHNTGIQFAIWGRTFDPATSEWPAETAHALASFGFSPHDRQRMSELATKSNEGSLSDDEQAELAAYREVALVLDLIHAKAIFALRKQRATE